MRIDDLNRYTQSIERLRTTNPANSVNPAATGQPGVAQQAGQKPAASSAGQANGTDRADKIAKLKEAIRSGQTPDLQKLADTLLESGIFFDEKA